MPSSSIYPLDVYINIRHARICRWRWRMIWLAISLLCPFCLSIEFHLQLKPTKKDVHSHPSIHLHNRQYYDLIPRRFTRRK